LISEIKFRKLSKRDVTAVQRDLNEKIAGSEISKKYSCSSEIIDLEEGLKRLGL